MKILKKNVSLEEFLERRIKEWRELVKEDKHAMSLQEVCGILSPELEYLIQDNWSNYDIARILIATLWERNEDVDAQNYLKRSREARELDLKSFLDNYLYPANSLD